jgi:uncharacterized protein (DUF427 family)
MEAFTGEIKVLHHEQEIAVTNKAFRILETSHPPVYYIPSDDCDWSVLSRNDHRSFCEWKGEAAYVDLILPNGIVPNVAWYYPNPRADYQSLANYLAFYPSKIDQCFVNGERVEAQEGDFYGGWITENIVGPFKGAPGTWGW